VGFFYEFFAWRFTRGLNCSVRLLERLAANGDVSNVKVTLLYRGKPLLQRTRTARVDMIQTTRLSISTVKPASALFLHANGYPTGVYRQFLYALTHALGEHALVHAPAILDASGSKPHLRWATMLGQAQHHASLHNASILIGHSMGGYLALQTAAAAPEKFTHVVLIDSPIPRGWRAALLGASQVTGLAYKFGPAPIAARRRDAWATHEAAHAFFAGKNFVKKWHAGVLDDFIEHAIIDAPNSRATSGVMLRIARDVERDIYAHIVHTLAYDALMKLRKQKVPVHFIAGARSEEIRLAGRESNHALFAPQWTEIEAGHLIPFEQPQLCADAVAALITH
jgi:pimeloyl-ACP methyl ester carboxylesterase